MSEERKKGLSYGLEGVAFGLADGIICFLGIILGVAEATKDVKLVIISGIVGGIADALGNSFGFFVSQSTERGIQIHNVEEHNGRDRIHSTKEVVISSGLSFVFTLLALAILLVPFAFLSLSPAMASAFIIGPVTLFILGSYVGKMSKESQLRTAIKFAVLGIIGAIISYFVGNALGHLMGV